MITLMYHSNMLTPEQISLIPRTTRNEWNKFKHEDYYGYSIAKDYIEDFNCIKDVLVRKHIKHGIKLICTLSYGYKNMLKQIENNKKLLREHSQNISYSILQIARHGNINISDASKIMGVRRNWFYRHRNKKLCSQSKIGKCFKQHPNQLTISEVSNIEKVLSYPENYCKPRTTIYYDAIRKGAVTCSISTFFKYANSFGYFRRKQKRTKRNKGFIATRPFEWLHVDVTHIQTVNDGMQYVAFVKDNYSKALLGYKSTSNHPTSEFIKELFVETFLKYNLFNIKLPINIISDGGSENKGSLIEWINQVEAPPIVRKLTAKTDEFPFSNSMSESTHSIYKTEFMNKQYSLNIQQHINDLDRFMIYYNYERFPFLHFGLNPIEVLNGAQPNRQKFKELIYEARKDRIRKNRNYNECYCILR